MQYLYKEGDSFVFMDTSTYDQVHIPHETIGDDSNFLPEQIVVEVLFFNDRAVGVTLPNFIEQKVMETEPGFRGDTATGVTKPAKISTGATIAVPLFINEGDIIKIDTRNGEYLERVGRA
jgi:elongation factor P